MKKYQERFTAAYNYWIAKDEPPSAARDLAREQIEFEDRMDGLEWKGSNDSLENLPWI